jgi:UDP-2,3-diacylglucosamine hydrolase
MQKKFYFISDVHLGSGNNEINKKTESLLIEFFEEIKSDAEELFIAGDLFDFWIEYKRVVPRGYYNLFAKISDLVKSGIKITFLAGNHDFWRGNYFEEEFGIKRIDHPIEREIYGKKFFIAHGDGYSYKDTGYKIAKFIVRSRICQFLYSILHPNFAIWLAKRTSARSRDYTTQKDFSERDGLRDFAKRKIEEGFDYVILGHRHFTEFKKTGNGIYINLGDWIKNFSYGVFDGSEFILNKYYDIQEKRILPAESRKIKKQD